MSAQAAASKPDSELATSFRLQRASGSTMKRAAIVTAVIALAFAAPSLVALSHGSSAPSEARLARTLLSAYGGITLPILGAAVAAAFFGVGALPRTRADRLVSAGLAPRTAVWAPMTYALISAVIPVAAISALTVVTLRMSMHLTGKGVVLFDALTTAWAVGLGAAMWTSLALLFVVRGGRPGRAYIVVAIDLACRIVPGAAAWLSPSAHLANLLGAPPARGLVRVPILSQQVSIVVLVLTTATLILAASRRYRGAPAR